MNCWEFMKCGREAGGKNAEKQGICPAYRDKRLHRVHEGMNAGRACWMIAGTNCGGRVQGTFAEKEKDCLNCEFYRLVCMEESAKGNFRMYPELIELLIKNS